MSGNHPKLILDGIKTQTRRVMKPQPEKLSDGYSWRIANGELCAYKFHPEDLEVNAAEEYIPYCKCPYGQVGDRLWVRETWMPYNCMGGILYKADGDMHGRWKPSIHMFRKDSRITLEITEVRVERVQEIDSWDCIHEGIHQKYHSPVYNIITDKPNKRLITDFHNLWDSLNAKRGYGWEVNPWVWVISFKELI